MSQIFSALIGAIVGFFGGGVAGAICGMLWISVFPPDRIAGGPEAGFGTVLGFGIAGELIGIAAGIAWAVRRGRSRAGS